MVILERDVQHIYPDKWDELNAIDGEFNQIESGLGFPAKKRFQLLIGADEVNTLIVERQWPSMAAMEAAYEKAMADGQPFDLVVLDLAMPVMSGQECIKELLAIDPEAKILVMSGLMEDLDKDEALRKVRRYLRKPFFLPVLLEEVRKALGTDDWQSA